MNSHVALLSGIPPEWNHFFFQYRVNVINFIHSLPFYLIWFWKVVFMFVCSLKLIRISRSTLFIANIIFLAVQVTIIIHSNAKITRIYVLKFVFIIPNWNCSWNWLFIRFLKADAVEVCSFSSDFKIIAISDHVQSSLVSIYVPKHKIWHRIRLGWIKWNK